MIDIKKRFDGIIDYAARTTRISVSQGEGEKNCFSFSRIRAPPSYVPGLGAKVLFERFYRITAFLKSCSVERMASEKGRG